MNEAPRSNVFVIQRDKMPDVEGEGLASTALTAGLKELRLIVRQARLTSHAQLPLLESLLAAREEANEAYPEPEM